jgi:hypothetical protein
MNGSAIWAIVCLAVTSVIAMVTLTAEKKEEEKSPSWIRRYRRVILYVLIGLSAIGGVWQIKKADMENREAEQNRQKQHELDQQQITGLEQKVESGNEENEKQYQRNQTQLEDLRDRLAALKLSSLTERDRDEIATLQKELNESLAKATIDFGFGPSSIKNTLRKDLFVTSNGNPVKVPIYVLNTTAVNAKSVIIWTRICERCKFRSEPRSSFKAPGAPESDRLFKWPDLPGQTTSAEIELEIDVPREITRMEISLTYRCETCAFQKEWQGLWVDVGQLPLPNFYTTPAKTSKNPPAKFP